MFDMSRPTPRVLAATILLASANYAPDDTLVFSIIDPDTNKPIEIELTACEFVGKCICELIASNEIPNYYGVTI